MTTQADIQAVNLTKLQRRSQINPLTHSPCPFLPPRLVSNCGYTVIVEVSGDVIVEMSLTVGTRESGGSHQGPADEVGGTS